MSKTQIQPESRRVDGGACCPTEGVVQIRGIGPVTIKFAPIPKLTLNAATMRKLFGTPRRPVKLTAANIGGWIQKMVPYVRVPE